MNPRCFALALALSINALALTSPAHATEPRGDHARVIVTRTHLPRDWDDAENERAVLAVRRAPAKRGWGGVTESSLEVTVAEPGRRGRIYRVSGGVAQAHGLSFAELTRLLRDPDVFVALRIDARYGEDADQVLDLAFHPACDLDLTLARPPRGT